jgi:hypothetical protein
MYIVQRDAQEETRNSYEHLIFADQDYPQGCFWLHSKQTWSFMLSWEAAETLYWKLFLALCLFSSARRARIFLIFFNIHGSMHHNNILLYKSQQDAYFTEFILSDNCSTWFRRYYHPSSGAQTTVTTASGNRYTVLLSAAIVEELELKSVPNLSR